MAAVKLAIQIVGNILAQRAGYGIFRDEMYYLICGRHLAFGYVDQPPMVALQARLTDILFGYDHMWSLRLISGIAGAFKMFLTGALVWAMGGSRRAAALAMLGVTVAGVYLGIDSYLSMNSFEPVFWLPCALALIRIVQAESLPNPERVVRNWWIVLGVSAGLGLENKDNEVFFLVAVLIALRANAAAQDSGQPLVRRRRVPSWWRWPCPISSGRFTTTGPPSNGCIGISKSNKDVKLPPLRFLLAQMMMLTPWTVFLWLQRRGLAAGQQNGAAVSFSRRALPGLSAHDDGAARQGLLPCAGVSHLFCGRRDVLAAGARKRASLRNVRVERVCRAAGRGLCPHHSLLRARFCLRRSSSPGRRSMHFQPTDSENHDATILPQFYADRFGWHEMVEKVARIYNSLPPQERAVTGIYTGNYGEASAINLFGPKYGLPVAISGHQTYWLWGPHGYTGQEMIIINGATLAEMKHVTTPPASWPTAWIILSPCRGRRTSSSFAMAEKAHMRQTGRTSSTTTEPRSCRSWTARLIGLP